MLDPSLPRRVVGIIIKLSSAVVGGQTPVSWGWGSGALGAGMGQRDRAGGDGGREEAVTKGVRWRAICLFEKSLGEELQMLTVNNVFDNESL